MLAGHTVSFNLLWCSYISLSVGSTWWTSVCPHSQLVSTCYSFGLKCSHEWYSGEVLEPLRGGVLWEVLGSLGEGNPVTPGFSSFDSSWSQVSNFVLLCASTVLCSITSRTKENGNWDWSSGSINSDNPSLLMNYLPQLFCSSVRTNYHRKLLPWQ